VEESVTWLAIGPQPELAAAGRRDAGGLHGRPWGGGGLRFGVQGRGAYIAKGEQDHGGGAAWAGRGRSGSNRTAPGREDVRRRDVPGRGQVGSTDFGAPRRACYLGTERLRWEGAGQLGYRGTVEGGAPGRARGVAWRAGARPQRFANSMCPCSTL
jgi:hypothetical protein